MTERQAQHTMMIQPTHDERARQELCQAMRVHLLTDVQSGTKSVFNHRVHPAYKKEHGHEVKDRHEIRRAMSSDPYYRVYSASLRSSQELMWDSIIDTVEHEMPRLQTEFKKLYNQAIGSLTLDPDLEIPRYHTAADIHLQPNGYHTDVTENDLSAGAIFDRGLYMYGDGKFGPYSDAMGHIVTGQIKALYPDFSPKRILDMGCTSGNSTLVYVDAFPEAEVHAVDVGAPVLRYAHARAETLGKTVHFAQANAEHTNYQDNSFDLIVSHILFHETGRTALTNIMRECHRLLKPGGMMVHLDIPQDRHCDDVYDSFLWDWEAYNNNETFCVVMRSLDYEEEAAIAGFEPDNISIESVPVGWPLLVGKKAA